MRTVCILLAMLTAVATATIHSHKAPSFERPMGRFVGRTMNGTFVLAFDFDSSPNANMTITSFGAQLPACIGEPWAWNAADGSVAFLPVYQGISTDCMVKELQAYWVLNFTMYVDSAKLRMVVGNRTVDLNSE